MRFLMAAASLALAVYPVLAAPVLQSGTDFSGRWALRSKTAAPDTPHVLVVEQPITTKNVRGEPMPPAYLQISIRRVREGDVTTETHRIGVRGGSVGGPPAKGERPPRAHQETVCEGDTLVFSSGTYTGDSHRTGQWAERREAWSLAADGTLLIEISTEGSGMLRQTQRLIYARQ